MPKFRKSSKRGVKKIPFSDIEEISENIHQEKLAKVAKKQLEKEQFFFEDKGINEETKDIKSIRKERKNKSKQNLESKELRINQNSDTSLYQPLVKKSDRKFKGKTFVQKLADNIVTKEFRKKEKENIENENEEEEEEEEEETKTNDEKVPNKFDIWGDQNVKKKKLKRVGKTLDYIKEKKQKNRNNLFVKLPHPGQSINPDQIEHQEAIELAFNIEKKLVDKGKSITQFLNPNTKQQKGGDDVLDGISAMRKPEQVDPNQVIYEKDITKRKKERQKMKKTPKQKRIRRIIEKQEKLKKLRKLPSIKKIVEELNKPKIVKEKPEKVIDNRITSGNDVLLTDEIPKSLKNLQFNSLYILNENLKSLHNRKIDQINNINKTHIQLDNETIVLERDIIN